MYDPLETKLSFNCLKELAEKCREMKFGIIGGWGVFFHVNENYRKAFGSDYLMSRDIDVFIHSRREAEFEKILKESGYIKSGYFFRYKLLYDREKKKFVSEKESARTPLFNLIEVFLDIFSEKKTKIIGSWDFENLKKAGIKNIQHIPVVDVGTLFNMKCISFFEREKFDKEFKDACDIYALIVYSGEKIRKSELLNKTIKKILSRDDICDFIANHVLKDSLKSGLVKKILRDAINSG
ncbi:MAG: nucleotidyl transferase AbiEii/AbiGii toxin family protein [Candidatus Aenigmarchaeota archaeon]|nr:nucleotidyl transferase AbiEii/AbiGii toxin family protein [Candidatus Aenigmarchaeota archaeon]